MNLRESVFASHEASISPCFFIIELDLGPLGVATCRPCASLRRPDDVCQRTLGLNMRKWNIEGEGVEHRVWGGGGGGWDGTLMRVLGRWLMVFSIFMCRGRSMFCLGWTIDGFGEHSCFAFFALALWICCQRANSFVICSYGRCPFLTHLFGFPGNTRKWRSSKRDTERLLPPKYPKRSQTQPCGTAVVRRKTQKVQDALQIGVVLGKPKTRNAILAGLLKEDEPPIWVRDMCQRPKDDPTLLPC